MSDGYIKLYRKIRDHWIWQEPTYLKWWIDLLLLVNYEPKKVIISGNIQSINIGEHHTSVVKLSERWFVDRRTVDKFLKMLAQDGMITITKNRKTGTTVKVLNYKDYQVYLEADMHNTMNKSVYMKTAYSPHKEEPKNLITKEEEKILSGKPTKTDFNEKASTIKFKQDSFEISCVDRLIESCVKEYPNSKAPKLEDLEEKQKWAAEIEKMKRLDGRKETDILFALEYAITDMFWKSNVRSAGKFREKFETLFLQGKAKQNKTNNSQNTNNKFNNFEQSGTNYDALGKMLANQAYANAEAERDREER